MKKLCLLLAVLLVMLCFPVMAEDISVEMANMMLGEWVHEAGGEHYLLFDGVDKFYYSTEESFYYGVYTYQGDSAFLLIDDVEEERTLYVDDDLTLTLSGVEGGFTCRYRYALMDFPNTDAGSWLHDDGATTLQFDIYGNFELETEDAFYFGTYEYLGGGDYLLTDEMDGSSFLASNYVDGSVGVEGMDGYFWLQADGSGEDPFELFEADEDLFEELLFAATPFDGDPIPLSGVWYKFGDPSTMPFVLDGDAYSCENSVFGSETTGTWYQDEIVLVLTDEETAPSAYLHLEADGGVISGWNPVLMAGNRLLYADGQDTYFLYESLIGTEEGDLLCKMADFMRTDWYCTAEGTTMVLEFSCMDNVVVFTTFSEDTDTYREIVGKWRLEDGYIVADYTDETSETYALPAETIQAGGMIFTKW